MSAADDNDGASAPGVAFAYDVAKDEISEQKLTIREVNGRLGFLLAAALTFSTYYFKEVHDARQQFFLGLGLLCVLVLVLIGFIPRTYFRAPNPRAVAEEANNRPGRIKELALGTLLQAVETNARIIKIKNAFYGWALLLGVGFVIVSVGFEAADGMVHWIANHERGRAQVHRLGGGARSHVTSKVRAHGGAGTVPHARDGLPTRRPQSGRATPQ